MSQHQPHPPVQHDPQVGPATMARLVLRYRPAADVLIGVIDLPVTAHSTDTVETPDADTRLCWRIDSEGPLAGQSVLQSFEVIHAHTRWQHHSDTVLPIGLYEVGKQFTEHEHQQHLALPLAARYTARIESSLTVPLSALRREHTLAKPAAPGTRRDAVRVARTLDRVADALEASFLTGTLHDQHPARDSIEHQRTVTFCSLLRELGGAIADHHPLPAPGSSAIARQALLGGIPLGNPERDTLRVALTDIDRADRWGLVAAALEQLTSSLIATSTPTKGTPLD